MSADDRRFDALTEKIIGCAYKVGNVLGRGFCEKVYENALAHELRKRGVAIAQQVPLQVWYDGIVAGEFVADIVVEGVVIVELKAVKAIDDAHWTQCLNYLAATRLPLCLLINFAARVQVKRIAGPTLVEPPGPAAAGSGDVPPMDTDQHR